MGKGEDDVIVGDGQQFGGTFRQPSLPRRCLAFGTVPVQTRVVGDGSLSATIALLHVPSERGRSFQTAMAQQDLDRAQIGARFE